MRTIILFITLLCATPIFAQTKLSADDFLKQAENKNSTLLDVRTEGEFKSGTIFHAKNVDWSKQEAFKAATAKLDKAKPVYVFCFSGGRSEGAAKALTAQGYKVYELDGGMLKMRAGSDDGGAKKGMSLTDFESLKLSDDYVLVDFTAKWCAPCQKMKPYLEKINKNKTQGVKVVFIDADANSSLLKDLKISAISKLQLFKKGKLVWEHNALIEEAALVEVLKKNK